MNAAKHSRLNLFLVFTLASIMVCTAAWAQDRPADRYYSSNDLGMPLQEIGWYRSEEFSYVLVVEPMDDREVRRLLYQGGEIRRWEISASEEKLYKQGELAEVRLYDGKGRLSQESLYREGAAELRIVYYYSGEDLSYKETYDGQGRLLYTDLFSLAADGEVRRVRRRPAAESESTQDLALSGTEGLILEERYGSTEQRNVNRFDRQGRLVVRELWKEGLAVERERYRYRGELSVLESSELEHLLEDRITVGSYDEQGHLILERVQQGEKTIEETRHVRDQEGRIVETTRRGQHGIENWLYEYEEDGSLKTERYSVRGSLQRITRYATLESAGQGAGQGSKKSRVEELYRDGELFMKIHYQSSEKVKEEFIRNGEVVRVRTFQ